MGYGQLVAPYGESGGHFYVAVFDGVYRRDQEPDLDAVVAEPLVALPMDALLVHGHWQVVGRREVDPNRIPWPAYKVGVSPPGTFDVVDHTGQHRRRATDEEAESLPFRTVVAPIRLEEGSARASRDGALGRRLRQVRPVNDDQTSGALLPG